MPKAKCEKLTPKQQKFVEEYLIDLNATQAAIRAGYSAKTAGRIAQELLIKTHISYAIKSRRDALSKKTEVSQERIVAEMARLAFLDCRKFFNDDGTPIPIHKLSDDAAAAIVGVDVVQIGNAEIGVGSVIKYKMPDKNKALENLAKILGYMDRDRAKEQDTAALLAQAMNQFAQRMNGN